ncbi:MAG: hypothetical protein DMF15_06270 [Verrucomicrobia bacterium]|nr:MAG: hypothetical protein DMF15_06270 [Verrucomicrobiota bacterium]
MHGVSFFARDRRIQRGHTDSYEKERSFCYQPQETDEAWNVHSHARGDHFLDHFFLYSLRTRKNFAGQGKNKQEIRSHLGGFLFTAADDDRICSDARGSAPARGTLSLEKGNRDNRFLDRRATDRKQSHPNRSSSWDKNWTHSYGGFDNPDRGHRTGYIPANFTPKQNPFYCALPYNDKASTGHRSEAPQVVPWFKDAYQGPAVSTCKGRWVAIHKGNRVAYAQWEDAGPFRTDHWQYVFGNERPKPNLNKGAGLDVSPAVRDFLGLGDTDVTDWRFVDFEEVPHGPWAQYGDNNTFVINQRQGGSQTVRSHSNADLIR